jgi:Uma2 family endonuclease
MASEDELHSWLRMQIAKRFILSAGDAVQVMVKSTPRLSPTNAPDPDLHLYDADRPLGAVNGANVGLVIEVAQSTIRSDLAFKPELYAQHGVRDYWVVDANTDTIIVHRDPLDSAHREVNRHSTKDTVIALVLPGIALSLSDLPPIR